MEEKRELLMELCELAANEQDPDKLMALTDEIIRLLDEKQKRLNAIIPPKLLESAQPPK